MLDAEVLPTLLNSFITCKIFSLLSFFSLFFFFPKFHHGSLENNHENTKFKAIKMDKSTLIVACENGDYEIVKFKIEAKDNLEFKDPRETSKVRRIL